MKKWILMLIIVFLCLPSVFAQTKQGANTGKEIRNLVSAVKAASPGDYILLPSGKKYVLTKEEIAIAKGEFDYDDLSGTQTEVNDRGIETKTISQAHIAYIYPDGQATHILKTSVSFTAFMRHISNTFYLVHYIDFMEDPHEYIEIDPPNFDVFRASIQFQTISDGIEELQAVNITAYNYDGENVYIRYCSAPDMVWGNIPDRGSYKPVGESHKIEFDVE